jgi:integrase
VLPTGRKAYYLVYRLKGKRNRYLLGIHDKLSPDGARQLARSIAGEVANGIEPNDRRKTERRVAERERSSTLRVFIEGKYAQWARGNLKAADAQLERIAADFKDWLDKPMGSITPWLIETYRKKRRDLKRSPKTINRELQRLRSAVAKAVAWGVLDEHPFADVKPLKTDKTGRVRYLSADEEKRLREALVTRDTKLREARDRFNEWREARHVKLLPRREAEYVDHLRPMVLVAMNTGLRRGELLSLKWAEVNLEGKLITVRGGSAKTGQTRRVPLNAEALNAFSIWKKQAKASATFVFPAPVGGRMARIDRSWETVSKLAMLSDFRFHDLRHHFASKLVMAGVPLNTVRELLGHTSLEMTQRYSHLSPDALATAVEKLGAA